MPSFSCELLLISELLDLGGKDRWIERLVKWKKGPLYAFVVIRVMDFGVRQEIILEA